MGLNAGRLVKVEMGVCGNSPSIASVFSVRHRAQGFAAAGRGEISKERRMCEVVT